MSTLEGKHKVDSMATLGQVMDAAPAFRENTSRGLAAPLLVYRQPSGTFQRVGSLDRTDSRIAFSYSPGYLESTIAPKRPLGSLTGPAT